MLVAAKILLARDLGWQAFFWLSSPQRLQLSTLLAAVCNACKESLSLLFFSHIVTVFVTDSTDADLPRWRFFLSPPTSRYDAQAHSLEVLRSPDFHSVLCSKAYDGGWSFLSTTLKQ